MDWGNSECWSPHVIKLLTEAIGTEQMLPFTMPTNKSKIWTSLRTIIPTIIPTIPRPQLFWPCFWEQEIQFWENKYPFRFYEFLHNFAAECYQNLMRSNFIEMNIHVPSEQWHLPCYHNYYFIENLFDCRCINVGFSKSKRGLQTLDILFVFVTFWVILCFWFEDPITTCNWCPSV